MRTTTLLVKRMASAILLVFAGFHLVEFAGPTLDPVTRGVRLVATEPPSHLPVPVAGLRPADLRDSWGARRPGGRRHQGIDIFAPRGRPIVSTTGGIVVKVGHNRLGGRVVSLLGPGGYWHYYAHLETFGPIRAGQAIQAGTLIGYVGDSGNAKGTPPHLHYGIYRFGGGAINPYPLLAQKTPAGLHRRQSADASTAPGGDSARNAFHLWYKLRFAKHEPVGDM